MTKVKTTSIPPNNKWQSNSRHLLSTRAEKHKSIESKNMFDECNINMNIGSTPMESITIIIGTSAPIKDIYAGWLFFINV